MQRAAQQLGLDLAVILDLGTGDLNDAMRRSDNWPNQMARQVDLAVAERARTAGVGVSR